MAQEPKSSRPRAASASQGDQTEPAMAPITTSTPLPPLNPLPLSSQGADDPGSPAYPPQGLMPPDVQTPPPAQSFEPKAGKAGWFGNTSAPAIPTTWAFGSIFIMMMTSLVLLTVLAANAANAIHREVPIWTMVIIVIANILYTLIVVNLSSGQGALSLPFLRPRRGA